MKPYIIRLAIGLVLFTLLLVLTMVLFPNNDTIIYSVGIILILGYLALCIKTEAKIVNNITENDLRSIVRDIIHPDAHHLPYDTSIKPDHRSIVWFDSNNEPIISKVVDNISKHDHTIVDNICICKTPYLVHNNTICKTCGGIIVILLFTIASCTPIRYSMFSTDYRYTNGKRIRDKMEYKQRNIKCLAEQHRLQSSKQ